MTRTDASDHAFDLRIFSYLPNPRIWKAIITARLCDVRLDIRGSKPMELQDWLWDFDAHPLSDAERNAPQETARQAKAGFSGRLFKTEAFLDAHPFGTVPAAFSPDGSIGIFESNSIMRAVARLGEKTYPAYGTDAYAAARIDSFLDASLVFARDTQIYLFGVMGDSLTADVHARAKEAFHTYLAGIERGLTPNPMFLVGDDITLADICFVAEMALFSNERTFGALLAKHGLQPIYHDQLATQFPRAMTHFNMLGQDKAFAPEVVPYLQKIQARVSKGLSGIERITD